MSKSSYPFDKTKLVELAQRSFDKNEQLGIDGFLCYKNMHFLQYIEGEKRTVLNLFYEIQNDKRHSIIASFEDDNLHSQRFSSWAMRLIDDINSVFIELEDLWEKYFSVEHRKIAHLNEEKLWRVLQQISDRNRHLKERESFTKHQFLPRSQFTNDLS